MNSFFNRELFAMAIALGIATFGLTSASAVSGSQAGQNPAPGAADTDNRVICRAGQGPITYCDWDFAQGRPRIVQNLGRKPCIRDATWGFNNRGLWVRDGCEGEFVASR